MQVGGYLDAGHGEGRISENMTAAQLAEDIPNKCFAEIVCVAN